MVIVDMLGTAERLRRQVGMESSFLYTGQEMLYLQGCGCDVEKMPIRGNVDNEKENIFPTRKS